MVEQNRRNIFCEGRYSFDCRFGRFWDTLGEQRNRDGDPHHQADEGISNHHFPARMRPLANIIEPPFCRFPKSAHLLSGAKETAMIVRFGWILSLSSCLEVCSRRFSALIPGELLPDHVLGWGSRNEMTGHQKTWPASKQPVHIEYSSRTDIDLTICHRGYHKFYCAAGFVPLTSCLRAVPKFLCEVGGIVGE